MNRAATTVLILLVAGTGAAAQETEARRTATPQTPTLPAIRTAPAGQSELSLTTLQDVPYTIAPELAKGTAPTARKQQAAMFDLPYFGNDLAASERYYVGKKIHSASGSQMWGYDIGAMRKNQGANTWSEVKASTDWNNPKNTDYYVYGKPVYAMADGTIIRCWRNAPQNPRPYSSALGDDFDEPFEQRDWLSQAWRDKKMSGAGNHLLVQQDDGNLVLYAHAQTGAIPVELCPHNATLYTKAGADDEGDVPVAQRKRIKAGDKLYLTGNSGNSSAPHLHVHQQDADGNPVQFAFRRGLSTPVASGKKADINQWTRFAGQRIPDGPVLFWPPERLGGESSRHAMAAGNFQRWFDHMVDSGFWLEWLDGYSVAGKAYLNHVWRPAKGEFRAYFLLSPNDYQARFTQAEQEKFYPVLVDSAQVGGNVRYSAIFVKNKPGGYLARHGLNTAQHMAAMDEAKSKHLNPTAISVVSVSGQPRYTVLWRSDNIGSWVVKSRIPEADYQALYDTQSQANRKPAYINAYMHQGKPFYSVVFAQMPGARKDRHGMSSAAYQNEFNDAMAHNLPTRAVAGIDGAAQQHRFIACWRM
jgi:hypothetical protein